MAPVAYGLEKWGQAPFFANKYCGLDESSPYNTPYNMNKVGLMNQTCIKKWGQAPFFPVIIRNGSPSV